jgi:hypothetical protein
MRREELPSCPISPTVCGAERTPHVLEAFLEILLFRGGFRGVPAAAGFDGGALSSPFGHRTDSVAKAPPPPSPPRHSPAVKTASRTSRYLSGRGRRRVDR